MHKTVLLVASTLILFFGAIGQVNLDSSLVGLFHFTGNADDESSLNLDGTVINATLSAGLNGNANSAYLFNGVNSVIECGTNDRNVLDTVTISAWFKTSSLTHQWIVAKYDWTDDKGYILRLDNGYLQLHGRNQSGQFIRTESTMQLNDGMWHHAIGVVHSNTWELWVDCVLDSVTYSTSPSPNLTNSEPLTIGNFHMGEANGDNNHFSGTIDEVRLYNRILSFEEKNILCDISHSGISENNRNISYNMFPNPTSSQTTISINNPLNDSYEIIVTNSIGQTVQQIYPKNQIVDIDLSGMDKGIYFVHISNSESRSTTKLLKH